MKKYFFSKISSVTHQSHRDNCFQNSHNTSSTTTVLLIEVLIIIKVWTSYKRMCKTSVYIVTWTAAQFFMLRKHANGYAKADIGDCGCMSSFAEQFEEDLNVKVREDTRRINNRFLIRVHKEKWTTLGSDSRFILLFMRPAERPGRGANMQVPFLLGT